MSVSFNFSFYVFSLVDLMTGMNIGSVNHDSKVGWLEVYNFGVLLVLFTSIVIYISMAKMHAESHSWLSIYIR